MKRITKEDVLNNPVSSGLVSSKKPASSNTGKAPSVQDQKVPTETKNLVTKWDASQVEAWFTEQNLDKKILEHFSPCAGEDLLQLYETHIYSPEMFHKMALQITEMKDPRSFIKFSVALKKLFE